MRRVLLAGASGLIGKQCLYELLAENEYSKVIVLVRKELAIKHHKLEQLIVDYDKLSSYKELLNADDVFCCLGTTIKKAGSQENFRKVDYEYPLKVAEIALANGAKQFLVVTALGANKKSSVFYNRVKGDVEESLQLLDYPALHIFRPSLLLGHRTEFRLGELVGKVIVKSLSFAFIGPLKQYKGIEGVAVAKAMVKTALQNQSGIHIHKSDEIAGIAENKGQ